MKNTPDIALVGCKQPLEVICGSERHLFEADGYLKKPPVSARKIKIVIQRIIVHLEGSLRFWFTFGGVQKNGFNSYSPKPAPFDLKLTDRL